MKFLVEEFSDLKDLQPFVPDEETNNLVQKSEVVLIMVLFKDENYTKIHHRHPESVNGRSTALSKSTG